MYKEDLALNNLQWLICHKTQPNQIIYILIYMYKEDLALNNLQWLICHKTPTRPTVQGIYKKMHFFFYYLHLNYFLCIPENYIFYMQYIHIGLSTTIAFMDTKKLK